MMDKTKTETLAPSGHDHIVAAAKYARAKHINADGSPLTEAQNAAILHAQVKAIIDGKFDPPATSEEKPEPEPEHKDGP